VRRSTGGGVSHDATVVTSDEATTVVRWDETGREATVMTGLLERLAPRPTTGLPDTT
jgi:hypothetical protein